MSSLNTIVLVEDDEGHAALFVKHLRRHGVQNPIHHFATGGSALAYLDMPKAPVEAPRLIVLDINLPDMPGTEVLSHISTRPGVKDVPVVMLTSSDDKADLLLSFDLGCRDFMIKPLQMPRFVEVCARVGCLLSLEPRP